MVIFNKDKFMNQTWTYHTRIQRSLFELELTILRMDNPVTMPNSQFVIVKIYVVRQTTTAYEEQTSRQKSLAIGLTA